MQHRGEVIKEAIYKSGMPITQVAKRMGKSRRWVYLMYENPNVPIEIMLEIGSIIQTDFSNYIPGFLNFNQVSEPGAVYEQSAGYWKRKYIELLEEYNSHLKQKS
jgi:hypothetical protein